MNTSRRHSTTSAGLINRSAPPPHHQDPRRKTREVVVIGERLHDNAGEVVGTQSFYIDVTPTDEARQAAISEAVAEISDQRAVIEQVKGILIFVYHIDDNAACDLLRRRSQETNTKLRSLAQQLMDDVRELDRTRTHRSARPSTRLLLTAHPRVRAKAARVRGAGVAPRDPNADA